MHSHGPDGNQIFRFNGRHPGGQKYCRLKTLRLSPYLPADAMQMEGSMSAKVVAETIDPAIGR